MAGIANQAFTTFDDYVLNFRSELQNVAKSCLAGLESKIAEEGDGWLDAHIEALFSSSSSGPIVEHLKTPSKTATAKKTRARLEAEKQRTDKIKTANAKLALSPSRSMNGSPARLLFQPNHSPLQPRSMNATSPSPIRTKLGHAKPVNIDLTNKAKKGKGKQIDSENTAPGPARNASRPGIQMGSPSTRSTRAALSPIANSPTRPVKSPLRQTHVSSPSPRSPVTRSSRPQSPRQVVETSSASNSRPSSRAAIAAQKDLSIIAEGTSERSSAASKSYREPIRSPPRTRPQSPRLAAQQAARSPRSPARKEDVQGPSIDAILRPTSSAASIRAPVPVPAPAPVLAPVVAAPVPVPAPAVPNRAVRSSWLSKALGAGGVPGAHPEATSAFRKSVVPQARPTLHNDYAGLRQSLAPPHGLKRKSDHGVEEEEPASRPEKVVKIETPVPSVVTTKPLFERKVSQPSAPTPAPVPTTTPATQPQSEILKVTRALEEIKERTQAKELAKQKAAALASASGNGGRAGETSGGGFLRGLTKSLGLGGRVESPEDEAERLARELEDDRQAEADAQAMLDQLMNEHDKERSRKEEEVKPVTASAPARSTTPAPSPPVRLVEPSSAHVGSDRTEEEMDAEEEQMVEDISFVEEEEEIEVETETVHAVQQPQPRPVAPIAALAPRLQTPPKLASIRLSTTPTTTPPAHLAHAQRAAQAKAEIRSPKKAIAPAPAVKTAEIVREVQAIKKQEVIDVDDDTAEEDDDDDDMEIGVENVAQHVKQVQKGKQVANTVPRIPKSSSSASLAPLALSNGLLNQASTIAAKTLGVKPTTAPVKSVQLAQAAAKKEQDAAGRKQNFREQAEARRLEAARKKAEDEKIRLAEQERIKQQEKERSHKLKAELERKKAEREVATNQAMKQQADRLQREAATAKAKAAEDEAARKRKMAPTLNKSTTAHPAKKAQPVNASGRETFRPTSSMKGAISQGSSNAQAGGSNSSAKLGPTSFRTAPAPPQTQPQPQPTVKLVGANPAHLGPPSRPSAMAGTHPHPQWAHIPTGISGPSNVLAQQRVALQSQLDDKAANTQSEDIVLPDINSEYSDSNDSSRSGDFQRPDWAESPELKAALQRQAARNPDELFGPIKPISMEELFKVKVSKFRPRSSSANWANGDGVTKKEEVEYAKRMGFRNTGARGEGSSGSGL